MTNKPMLSVDLRKALADFIEYSVPGPRSDDAMWYADKQALCAILDKPASQHQGEPVGYVSPAGLEGAKSGKTAMFRSCAVGVYTIPLYAESPAPVAVADHKGELADKLESLAETIYNSWDSQPGWVPWKDGMHGSKQNEARQIASRTFELALSGHAAEASKE